MRFSLETHSGPLSGFSRAPKTHLLPVKELGMRILRKAVVRLALQESETCLWFKKQYTFRRTEWQGEEAGSGILYGERITFDNCQKSKCHLWLAGHMT